MTKPVNESTSEATQGLLRLESRPQQLVRARYEQLPFPIANAVQEVAFDLGITSLTSNVALRGIVFKGYSDHQLLFEQRWSATVLQQHTREEDLTIEAGTGLALRGLHFQIHGHQPLTSIDITAVAQMMDVEPNGAASTTQSTLLVPVQAYEQRTDLHFPLAGAWWIIGGNDWSDQHKQEVYSQPFALDLVKLGDEGRFFRGSGGALDEHFSWDAPIYATAGGKVAHVLVDMPDIAPGTAPDPRMFRDDPRRLLGNCVVISHANGEFSFFGHMQQASAQVRVGDVVRRNALLGRVGNSGRSPGPHLHVHMMEGPNLFIDRGLPMQFSHVEAGGHFFEAPIALPTRMIVRGPERE